MAYNYNGLGHFGKPGLDQYESAKRDASILASIDRQEKREMEALAKENDTFPGTPEMWTRVRTILDKKPLLTLARAKEMAMMK